MAPKRSAPPPPPPPPAASSEETTSGSGSDESEEVAPASPNPTSKNPPPPPQKCEESETSEEEEDEDDEEEPTHANPPSAPKNLPQPPRKGEESDNSGEDEEEEGESSESESESESDKAPPPKPAPKQEAEGKDLKPSSSVEAKKPAEPFHRTWSTDDEVRILEALAAHRREHGALPQPDALVAALAGSLDNRSYGRKELQGKVQHLKRRYDTATKKGELRNKDHDCRLFNLSKIVWGGDKAAAATANASARREFGEMCELYPYLAEEVKALEAARPGLFKREFGRIDDDKARSLDVKIKKQRLVQMKVELRRSDLIKEVTKVLMELVE